MSAKIILVTGANGGLGVHVTKALLEAGHTVIGLARRIQSSDFDHPHFTALPASLDSLDAAKKAVETILTRFGKLDALVHTVGGFAGGLRPARRHPALYRSGLRGREVQKRYRGTPEGFGRKPSGSP